MDLPTAQLGSGLGTHQKVLNHFLVIGLKSTGYLVRHPPLQHNTSLICLHSFTDFADTVSA